MFTAGSDMEIVEDEVVTDNIVVSNSIAVFMFCSMAQERSIFRNEILFLIYTVSNFIGIRHFYGYAFTTF